MSGLVGVLRTQAPIRPAEVHTMMAAMPYRGADGTGVWVGEEVGLGQGMLWTTPESRHETLPLVRGKFALVADIRLDNREALLPLLVGDLSALDLVTDVIPDGALLLAAYARWGLACVDHLLGAFAFALWDGRHRRLVCARDPVGIRQLYVHHAPGRQLAVATEIPALLALRGVGHDLDEDRVADVLGARFFEHTRTLYRDIVRLEAGHVLVATPEGVTRRRYWAPKISEPPRGDVVSQFGEIFEEAVRCRMRSVYPVGTELSGGLDSSSVTVLAARVARERLEPLHTFTAVFEEDTGGNEMRYVQAVLDLLGEVVVPHTFDPEGNPFVSLHEEIYSRTGIDRVSGSHYYNYISGREAGRAGVRVLLTGHDGDTTVGHGWELFAELARQGHWPALHRVANQCAARLEAERGLYLGQWKLTSSGALVNQHAVPVMYEWAEQKSLGNLLHGARGLNQWFDVPYKKLVRKLGRDFITPSSVIEERHLMKDLRFAEEHTPPTLRPELARGFTNRLFEYMKGRRRTLADAHTTSDKQLFILESAAMVANLEKFDLYPAGSHVEARHPFMDVRLIEFALSLPTHEKLKDGLTRSILRRAVGSLLPQEVAERAGKAHLVGAPVRAIESELEQVEWILANQGEAASFVDAEALQDLWERRKALGEWETVWLENAVTLSIGLRAHRGAQREN